QLRGNVSGYREVPKVWWIEGATQHPNTHERAISDRG
ncbi:MAG: hypothetical protein GM44_0980, partial [actinobacterium acAMD-2]